MSRIDRYLLQSLRADETRPDIPTSGMFHTERSASMLGRRGFSASSEAFFPADSLARNVIPLLIRVSRGTWSGEGIPDLRIHSRLGSVISASGSVASIDALAKDASVQCVEASRPVESPGELASSLPLVGATTVHNVYLNKGAGVLVAIIDAGIDVLHEAFQDSNGKTRILALWDQQDSTGSPRIHPFGYGTLHEQSDINNYIASGVVPAGLGRDPDGHGTHVASIAAGRAAGGFPGGMAPEAALIVVRAKQQRYESGQVASLGYSHNSVDALAWIDQVAQAQDRPVAVNVSLGMNAGSHDGSSLLEIAFDEFSSGGREPGRVIVKSAGNEGGRNGHAQVVIKPSSSAIVSWQTKNVSRDQDAIEVWFSSRHQLEFVLENPLGHQSAAVSLSSSVVSGTFLGGDSYDLDLERLHQDNGDSRLLIRIHRGGIPAVFAVGQWKLRVTARTTFGNCRLDAWIERRNARALEFTSHLVNDYSLSIPGTARTVIAVGSISPSAPFGVAVSSSRGPTRDERTKPELTAPGDGIIAAQAGTLSGTVGMGGTSMAAPHVTGALALLMSHWASQSKTIPAWRQLNAMQMRAALIHTVQGFNGVHHVAGGYGRLDAQALLDYF